MNHLPRSIRIGLRSGVLVLTLAAVSIATATAGPAPEAPPAALERVAWRGEPVAIRLAPGSERIVRFPGAVSLRVGLVGGPVPGLRIQPLDERLYLRAGEPFEQTRMLVQTGSGRSLLLDLSAPAGAVAGGPLEVLLPAVDGEGAVEATAGADARKAPQPIGYVGLVRFAAQSLYAPERLIPVDARIRRTPLEIEGDPVALVRGGRIEAVPRITWRAEGARGPLWITAVTLRNAAPEALDLDPRDLRGSWLATAFQHGHLGAAGRESDLTTAYLVSAQPFEAALGPFAVPPAPMAATGEDAR